MTTKTTRLGNEGESAVTKWLQKHGFEVLVRNYRTRLGEVDIIALKNEVVAFVEVKSRQTKYFSILQTITPRKQQRIIKAAKRFIAEKRLFNKVFRFDVAIVLFNENKGSCDINYLENAFRPQESRF